MMSVVVLWERTSIRSNLRVNFRIYYLFIQP